MPTAASKTKDAAPALDYSDLPHSQIRKVVKGVVIILIAITFQFQYNVFRLNPNTELYAWSLSAINS